MEAKVIELVKADKNAIKKTKMQTLAICEAAFEADKSCFKYLQYQSEVMCRQAILLSADNFKY